MFPAGKSFTGEEVITETLRLKRAFSRIWLEQVEAPITGSDNDPKVIFCLPDPIPSIVLTFRLALPEAGIIPYGISLAQMANDGAEYIDNSNSQFVFLIDEVLAYQDLGVTIAKQVNDSRAKGVVILSKHDYTAEGYTATDAATFQKLFPKKLVLVMSTLLAYDDGVERQVESKTGVGAIFNTSGTTGRAKGVVIPKERAAASFNSICLDFTGFRDVNENTIFLALLPLHASAGTQHGFDDPFLSGATIFLQPGYDLKRFPQDLLNIKRHVKTNQSVDLIAPVDHFRELLFCKNLPDGCLSHIRRIALVGSAITPADMQRFIATAKRLGITAIQDAYGCTEDIPGTSAQDYLRDKDNPSIKRLFKGSEYRILDKQGNDLPPGTIGNLFAKRREGTYQKYLSRPELDALAYPFDPNWRSTGDIAEQVIGTTDGFIIYGRSKDSFYVDNEIHYLYPLRNALTIPDAVFKAEPVKLNLPSHVIVAHVVLYEGVDRVEAYNEIMQACANLPTLERPASIKFVADIPLNPETGKRLVEPMPNDLDGYGINGDISFRP
jgi:acyl-CoA synthetase (AMP-forming)/AMP-acid ligase II